MKSAILALGTVCVLTAWTEEISFDRPAIVPTPVRMTFESNVVVRLNRETHLVVTCPDATAGKWVADHVERWFGFRPTLSTVLSAPDGVKGDEGYALLARPGRIALGANTLQGVRYALMALRQAAQRETIGMTLAGYWLPACEINDAPALTFRGLHVCWFPETSPALVERLIRLAGYYRLNAVVLENWGVFRSERHPWWGWRDGRMTKAEIARLRAIADDLGVLLVPQFNIFGHASLSRNASGKHAVLDLDPRYQPLYEPDGWNWCLSNPETLRVIRELVVEMHEAFGNPPYFHIGCDEAHKPGCARCRAARPYAGLVERNIRGVRELLKARGAQAMMWHDMLLERGDERWKPFYANGSRDGAAMLARLPRDIVICDWYYGQNYGRTSAPTNYQTLAYFAGLGFPTVTCPWNDPKATGLQGAYAAKSGLLGLLGTTWHHAYKRELPRDILVATAAAAWGMPADDRDFVLHWRQIGWDMGVKDYRDCGFVTEQVPSCTNVEIVPGG